MMDLKPNVDRSENSDLIVPADERCAIGDAVSASPVPLPSLASANSAEFLPCPELILPHLFDAQVERSPHALAVEGGGKSLSYRQLQRHSDLVAHQLRDRGVGPGSLVGVCLERSPEMVVGLLGILKAGGAYIALDPTYPPARLAYMVEHSRATLFLVQTGIHPALSVDKAIVFDLADCDWDVVNQAPRDIFTSPASPTDPAYVLYTSGSTGQPKGVVVPHRALTNLLFAMREDPGLNSDDVMLALTTLCFDISGVELFLPLIVGARVVLADREVARSGAQLIELLESSRVTALQATPATYRMLLDAGWRGAPGLKLFCGGEAMDRRLADALLARGGALWNMYGPTETTIYSIIHRVQPGTDPIPIGRPIRNTRAYVLDAERKRVAAGETGELYISGLGLALGYLHRSDLTSERFISCPFETDPDARMYRTGDLVRLLPDGELQCLGRVDHQVKLRGFRIELGEIETVLCRHPRIRQAVAALRESTAGEARLVAYVVPDAVPGPSATELRRLLADSLPDYMIPAAFVSLESFPLTPNGKVDRQALPDPAPERPNLAQAYQAARNAAEAELVRIWEGVLGIKPIGVHDNVFELGISSLALARLFAQVDQRFRKSIPPASIFQAPTIAQLADLLHQGRSTSRWTSLVAIQAHGSRPPLFCVHGGAGTIVQFYELARLLGEDQPFYGLQSRGLYGDTEPLRTVEDMAAHYIAELRTVQPHGPYLIVGFCFGGVVALEMAQRLRALGEDVPLLILLNAPAPIAVKRPASKTQNAQSTVTPFPSLRKRIATHLSDLWNCNATNRRALLRKKIVRYFDRHARDLRYKFYFTLRLPLPNDLRDTYFLGIHGGAELRYLPQPYCGKVALFHGEGVFDDSPRLWSGLVSRPIEVHQIPGDHFGPDPAHPIMGSQRYLFKSPAVELLAARLRQCLDRALNAEVDRLIEANGTELRAEPAEPVGNAH